MTYEFKFPDIGEGLVEGEITTWLIAVGDYVKEDQALCEVMTDKANVEIPSPVSGTVEKLLANEGDIVPVHQVIMYINTDATAGSSKPSTPPAETKKPEAKKEDRTDASQFDDIPLFSPTAPPKKKSTAAPKRPTASPVAATTAPQGLTGRPERPKAAPATRKLARELGVALKDMVGSGDNGRITPTDVRRASEKPGQIATTSSSPAASASTSGSERRIPLKGLRRKIAENMVKSKRTAPHYSFFEEVDFTQLATLRQQVKPMAKEKGIKISFMPFIIKAVVQGLKAYPIVNSTLDEDSQEIVFKGDYNIGIATATEQGLIVPVIKHCDRLSIFEIAAEINRVAEASRSGRAKLDDLRGSTFTLTNVGTIGGMISTPIINYPEVGIMGIHSIKKKPWVVDGQIVIRDISILSMSFDHRVVDGAVGALFTKEIVRYLENPGLLMFAE